MSLEKKVVTENISSCNLKIGSLIKPYKSIPKQSRIRGDKQLKNINLKVFPLGFAPSRLKDKH